MLECSIGKDSVDIQNGCCYLGRSMELRLFDPLAKSH